MIVQVNVALRRNVCGDIDKRFDNMSRSHHQGQVNCEPSVGVMSLVFVLIGRQTCDVIGHLSVIGCEDCKM